MADLYLLSDKNPRKALTELFHPLFPSFHRDLLDAKIISSFYFLNALMLSEEDFMETMLVFMNSFTVPK